MRSYYGTENLPAFRTPVVTLGSFDGVHRGHRALLDAAVDAARCSGGDSIAVTFLPHPRKVLKPAEKTFILSTIGEKLYLLEQSGIDVTVVIPFDEEFSKMDSQQFVGEIIAGRLGASSMVVGYDHRFGHNKQGGYDLLKESGLQIIRIPELKVDGLKISSTEVRRAVAAGDMAAAAAILGHPYIIAGTIRDNTVLFTDGDKLLPPPGEYRVEALTEGGNPVPSILTVGDRGELALNGETCLEDGREAIISFL